MKYLNEIIAECEDQAEATLTLANWCLDNDLYEFALVVDWPNKQVIVNPRDYRSSRAKQFGYDELCYEASEQTVYFMKNNGVAVDYYELV